MLKMEHHPPNISTMGKVNLILDTRRVKEGGRYPLKFGISFAGQYAYIPTGIDLDQKQWNGREIVKCEQKALYTQLINYKRMELEKAMIGLECRGVNQAKSSPHLKELLERQLSGHYKASTYPVRDAFEEKMKTLPKDSTRSLYRLTIDRMSEYSDFNSLRMSDIDYRWLCGFEQYLRGRGNKVNTIGIAMRNIRAVFRHLIKLGDIEADSYPFNKFSVKSEETAKRALLLDQMRAIRDEPKGPKKRYADIFMLTFYLLGINLIDLLSLREITPDGRIEYRRSKTGKIYSVKVEPEALAIIDRYRGTRHLIDILDRRKEKNAHKSFTSRMNKYLKEMIPGISSYWARHSWATIAAELEVPIETIAAALGHNIGNRVTAIYIKFNQQKVDEANRKVIDRLNEDLRQSGISGSSTV
ncbi:MAG: site-specific integrase [Bacteroidales bacterium]|nr:site-specific integrase [Bacteroidales bacterium]